VLASAQRLRRREEFTATVRRGRRAGRGSMVAYVLVPPAPVDNSRPDAGRPTGAEARAGFIVARAVGKAVVRNRVRRRLRHLMRERIGVLPEGAQVVIRILPSAAACSYRELATDLDAAIAGISRAGRRPSRSEVSR
jgi:ribonuclease P protein component